MKIKLSLNKKIKLIKQGVAYVAKADGGHFFYMKDGSLGYCRIHKKTYEALELLAWQTENKSTNEES
jgi:hypothetical protein